MRKIFLIIALAIASFTFAEEAQSDSIQTVETETIEYIEQNTDSIEPAISAIEEEWEYRRIIKVIENGIIIFIIDGVKYTVDGKLIE